MTDETNKRTRFKINRDSKIIVLAEANPRRKSSKTFEIFEQYVSGMTIGDFLEKAKPLGGGLVDIKADIARGHIKVEAPESDSNKAA